VLANSVTFFKFILYNTFVFRLLLRQYTVAGVPVVVRGPQFDKLRSVQYTVCVLVCVLMKELQCFVVFTATTVSVNFLRATVVSKDVAVSILWTTCASEFFIGGGGGVGPHVI